RVILVGWFLREPQSCHAALRRSVSGVDGWGSSLGARDTAIPRSRCKRAARQRLSLLVPSRSAMPCRCTARNCQCTHQDHGGSEAVSEPTKLRNEEIALRYHQRLVDALREQVKSMN